MTNSIRRWLTMGCLMLAGEAIFLLPYMRKTFQTSIEEVFTISSTELGFLSSMFGILALACYFPGGWLADRFSIRTLLSTSLIATGLGGFFILTIPSFTQLLILHAFWGITSILTFWAALLKATRIWGTPETQGASFGLLEGGRGIVAALIVTVATAAFALSDGNADPHAGLNSVVLVYSITPILAGLAVWLILARDETNTTRTNDRTRDTANLIKKTARIPEVWLLAVIIFFAYFIYTGSYYFPAYVERGLGETKLFGAQLGVFRDWLRPAAAIAAGVVADRIGISRGIAIGFLVLIVLYGTLLFAPSNTSTYPFLFSQVAVISIMVFALRAIYFALMEECKIPVILTGITVGIVSTLAYTPDIFSHIIAGLFLDHFKGIDGFRYFFGLLSVMAVAGLASTLALRHKLRNLKTKKAPSK